MGMESANGAGFVVGALLLENLLINLGFLVVQLLLLHDLFVATTRPIAAEWIAALQVSGIKGFIPLDSSCIYEAGAERRFLARSTCIRLSDCLLLDAFSPPRSAEPSLLPYDVDLL